MRLSILIFCCFPGTCWTSNNYCVYQPKNIRVKEGDSVTIPCSYTYTGNRREKSQIVVTWGERDGPYCSNIKKQIIDHSGNIINEYKDRISIVKDPDKNRSESLIIRRVKASDGIAFCCRVTIHPKDYTWKDEYGTSVNFADEDRLSQVEELMAVPGEEMIIPCHYSMRTLQEAEEVTWYTGNSILCDQYTTEIYSWDPSHVNNQYSLVNFPDNFSLRIHRVKENDHPRYCCRVRVRNGQLLKSRYATELTITGSPSSSAPFTVIQTDGVTGHEGDSVTLNCSYSGFTENIVLGVNIYWRLSNISGPYVYHPYKDMVHSNYSGRTEIKGAADLHIRGLQMSDNSTYYCFVMLKMCKENDKYERLIQYGQGTRLIVTESPNGLSGHQLVIIISISAVVLLLLLSVILVILKKRGFIRKKKNVLGQLKTPDKAKKEEFSLEERPYCEISTKNIKYNQDEKENMMEKEVDEQETENILYSELNKAKLQPRNPAPYHKQEEQTVYAAVISPNSRG